jgi:hypothetical protein
MAEGGIGTTSKVRECKHITMSQLEVEIQHEKRWEDE